MIFSVPALVASILLLGIAVQNFRVIRGWLRAALQCILCRKATGENTADAEGSSEEVSNSNPMVTNEDGSPKSTASHWRSAARAVMFAAQPPTTSMGLAATSNSSSLLRSDAPRWLTLAVQRGDISPNIAGDLWVNLKDADLTYEELAATCADDSYYFDHVLSDAGIGKPGRRLKIINAIRSFQKSRSMKNITKGLT